MNGLPPTATLQDLDFTFPTRPVLWLDNWGRAQKLRKDGAVKRLLSAQASPRWRRQGDGWAWACAPNLDELRAVQDGQITGLEYRAACLKHWRGQREKGSLLHLAPGHLRVYHPDGGLLRDPDWTFMDGSHVRDGDVLCCTCAAPGSPKRKNVCHVEYLAELLHQAQDDAGWGWELRLYGELYPPQQRQQSAPLPITPSPRPRRQAGRQRSLLEIA